MNTKDIITSRDNELVRLAASLKLRKHREEKGLYLLEGLRAIEEAVLAAQPVQYLFYSLRLLESPRSAQLIASAKKAGLACFPVADKLLTGMASSQTPQGIVAVVEKPQYRLSDVLGMASPFLVIIDAVQDPGNLGTIVRTALAAGVTGVLMTHGTVDFYNDKTLRASMGSSVKMPVVEKVELPCLADLFREKQIRLIATDVSSTKPYYLCDMRGSVAMAFGNEGAGLSPGLLELADEMVKIPMAGSAESLNVAVATGIMLFEAARQRCNG